MELSRCSDLFGQIIKHTKCFGLRYRTNDVLTFLARSSTPKIFRPEAEKIFSLALPQPSTEQMRQRRVPNFALFSSWRSSSASEMDAPMSGSYFLLPCQRQRSLSAIAIDAPALGSRILLHSHIDTPTSGSDYCTH